MPEMSKVGVHRGLIGSAACRTDGPYRHVLSGSITAHGRFKTASDGTMSNDDNVSPSSEATAFCASCNAMTMSVATVLPVGDGEWETTYRCRLCERTMARRYKP
jgi:hypothetical protein